MNLPSHSTTNFTFPFLFDYTTNIDPTFAIITDIAEKCLTSPQSDLTIKYVLTVGVKVFFVSVSPTITNSVSFTCPISTSDITVRVFTTFVNCSFELTILVLDRGCWTSLVSRISLDLGCCDEEEWRVTTYHGHGRSCFYLCQHAAGPNGVRCMLISYQFIVAILQSHFWVASELSDRAMSDRF